ncbi:hypothetical protein AB0K09_00935 [Streptomyces sp. NPDC049577]|uniref:hypothetical protein n=1 Tax=Streptomyces sp. NPDC049577 TaxID=3155153 RepID=UPI003412BFA6
MPSHAITSGRHRHAHEGPGPVSRGVLHHRSRAARVIPVVGGVAFGLYTVFLSGENGASAGHAWLEGLVAALVTGGLGHVLIRERHRMIAEVAAIANGALFGAAMGFLYSLSDVSVLRAGSIGLLLGACLAVACYYVFYNHDHPTATP